MKLAVALSERADIQRRLSELNDRLANNAKVQEGDSLPRTRKRSSRKWTPSSAAWKR